MTFGAPELLVVPPLILLLAGWVLALRLQRERRLSEWIPASMRERNRRHRAPDLRGLRATLTLAGLLAIAFSLSRPQWGYSWRDANRKGLEVMVAVDTSNSMRADDFTPTRLQRAKWGLEELIRSLPGDRVGLVAFAGEGVRQCPLTRDYGAFLLNVEDLFPGIVPRGGTNLAAALRTAMESFEEGAEADRVILLITDGEQHDGKLDEVIQALRENRIRVFAVGVGTAEGSLIPLDDSGGSFLKNRADEVVKSRLDEETLRRLASETDGLYVRADPRDFGVGRIVEEGLEPLQRAQLESQRVREMEERYQIFLGFGLACLLLEGLAKLPALFRRRPLAPSGTSPSERAPRRATAGGRP